MKKILPIFVIIVMSCTSSLSIVYEPNIKHPQKVLLLPFNLKVSRILTISDEYVTSQMGGAKPSVLDTFYKEYFYDKFTDHNQNYIFYDIYPPDNVDYNGTDILTYLQSINADSKYDAFILAFITEEENSLLNRSSFSVGSAEIKRYVEVKILLMDLKSGQHLITAENTREEKSSQPIEVFDFDKIKSLTKKTIDEIINKWPKPSKTKPK